MLILPFTSGSFMYRPPHWHVIASTKAAGTPLSASLISVKSPAEPGGLACAGTVGNFCNIWDLLAAVSALHVDGVNFNLKAEWRNHTRLIHPLGTDCRWC